MAVVDDLNDLLANERAEVEAIYPLVGEMARLAPDLVDGVRDIFDSARWACSGLYHALARMDEIPSLEVGSLPGRLSKDTELESKLRTLCRDQEHMIRRTNRLLSSGIPDEAAYELLTEIVGIHTRAREWCEQVIEEWRPVGHATSAEE